MVPLIQDEIVDKRKWIDKEDFIDLLALAQSVPGIFAVNIAIFIGYKLRNFRGALAMALGTILPSFFIMLAIALFFQQFKQYQIVENIFKGIRPAVVALIAAPTFSMAKSAKINRYTIWIPIVSALLPLVSWTTWHSLLRNRRDLFYRMYRINIEKSFG